MPPTTSVFDREPVPILLQSRVSDVAGAVVLKLEGEIDLSEAPSLASAFDSALSRADGVLVLDLEGVSFVDLAGMDGIISGLRRAAQAGRQVSVVSAGDRIRKLFAMMGNEVLLESTASLVDVEIAASSDALDDSAGSHG